MVDNSDQQYESFRDNVPYLFLLMALHPLLRRLFNAIYNTSGTSAKKSSKNVPNGSSSPLGSRYLGADDQLNQRIAFDVGFSLLFLLALHGFSAFKVFAILYINYSLATRLRKEYVPVVTWVFNIGILFANELGKGYPYGVIADSVIPWSTSPEVSAEQDPGHNWGAVLDSYGGLMPRWEISFNVTVLRLISFNLDYYWSLNREGGSPIEVCHR